MELKFGQWTQINAELQVLSPLVDIRKVNFLRFSKEHAGGLWAVVTWIAHSEYNEAQVHQLFRPLVRSGLAFGATRWLATLQRHCESLAALMSPSNESAAFPLSARRSMVKLAQRMTSAFCAGVCAASAAHEWSRLESDMIGENVRVMTRRSGVNDSAEPAGFVLSAATSVWIPMPPKRLFNFLGDAAFRSKWDILSNGGLMLEMVNIPKGQFAGNVVSLLRPSAFISNQTSMLILQETCMDESGATIVYAPVDVPAMHQVMNGSDSSYVGILPSGFAVLPDAGGAASLLTIGFQILVSTQPPEEAVSTANGLISRTVQKIKDAINLED
ncbi:homeobox-leucine zipper protein ROC5-like [Canna indica]|uniref:Homeobox-leucine zipper protein ROC5-like n=1 Tax=Canna indica TaxID=4628 RepID=A0AAQ3JZG6_9LILI|nr:homeobox-leucine zipper protein ROC5-like [Canna indica]